MTDIALREATRRRINAAALAALAAYAVLAVALWGSGLVENRTSRDTVDAEAALSEPSGPDAASITADSPADSAEIGVGDAVRPTRLRIPAIGVDTSLISLGLADDGTMQVPAGNAYDLAGWYELGAAPGNVGPAVIAGHVDSERAPSVFYRLDDVEPGTEIFVTDAAGVERRFLADSREQHGKDTFPTERVYGPTTGAELRLITCGGIFDRSADSYEDNVIVFARLAQVKGGVN